MTPEQQRMSALEIANRKRMGRAAIRRELFALTYRDGLLKAANLLSSGGNELVLTMKLNYLLDSIRHFGPTKYRRTLSAIDFPHSRGERRIGELTPRERAALTLVLRELARTAGDKNAVRRRGWKVAA